jgi:nucleoside-diphosphate-sugar epimerase
MLTHRFPEPVVPARVVILGSRGFVGGHLSRHLREAGVPLLDVPSSDIDLTAASSVEGLAERLRPDDSLVFVSALTPDKGRDAATMMRNLRMGEHVCAALGASPCAHVVYISSDAVYADEANPVRETSCTSPSSFHGTMHFVRERMLVEAARAAKVPLALLRPSLLFGPGDTHNGYGPNRFVRTAAAEGRIALFGQGEEKRDHVFISDVARLVDLTLRHRSEGILNVATGAATPFGDLAAKIAALANGAVRIDPSPRAPGAAIVHRHFDISALAHAWPGFRYTPVEEGLATSWRAATAGVNG